ncbi:MAG: hypothetical protein FWE19_07850 [Oscillospiraceae bacterium]|nr:hypothetical protein [Oscillospiraceae bacterium]
MDFSLGNRFDILRYSLRSYVVDGSRIFLIDSLLGQAFETEEARALTLDELNDFFDEGYERE